MPLLGSCWEHICSLLQDFYLFLADGQGDSGCLCFPEPLQLFSLFSLWGSSQAPPISLQRCGMFTNVQNSQWVKYLGVSTDVPWAPEWEGLCSSRVSCLILNPNSVPVFAVGFSEHEQCSFSALCFISSAALFLPWGSKDILGALGCCCLGTHVIPFILCAIKAWDNFSETKSHSKN